MQTGTDMSRYCRIRPFDTYKPFGWISRGRVSVTIINLGLSCRASEQGGRGAFCGGRVGADSDHYIAEADSVISLD
jgi:hypothetical protein